MDAAPFLTIAPGAAAPDDCWWMRTADDVRLRAALWRAGGAERCVVLLQGRTECIEKLAVPAAEWVARGWAVVTLDWRGQGLSDRLVEPRLKGHVGDFAEFQRDLDALLADPRVQATPPERILMAHSMGGAIAAAALGRPDLSTQFKAAILSAPMLGIALSCPMRAAAWLTVKIGLAMGMEDRWPPFGPVDVPYVLTDAAKADDNVLTSDPDMWSWMVQTAREHPDLSIATPTLGWFAAASAEVRRLAILPASPVPTLCLLGTQERVVDPKAVRKGAARLGAKLVEITGSEHELLIERPELRTQVWQAVDAFLAELGLA